MSSGFWFTIWPFAAGIGVGLIAGVAGGIALGCLIVSKWRRS